MTACTDYIQPLIENECLYESLPKINNNFANIEQILCNLKERFDSRVEVRTFFYYGPNAEQIPTDSMNDNEISRPSDTTIQAFVNSSTQLNLPAISKINDIAYVIYQKTGFLSVGIPGQATVASNQIRYETIFVPQPGGRFFQRFTPVTIGVDPRAISNTFASEDIITFFAPIFVVWRLTYTSNGAYIVDSGFPKFIRSQTNSSQNAFNPQTWSTY